jgi:hypothetical protein
VMKIDNQGTWAQNAEVVSAVNLTHWVLLYPKEKCSREAGMHPCYSANS